MPEPQRPPVPKRAPAPAGYVADRLFEGRSAYLSSPGA
jgi:hypothetical protein